jgi:hypothetical protein
MTPSFRWNEAGCRRAVQKRADPPPRPPQSRMNRMSVIDRSRIGIYGTSPGLAGSLRLDGRKFDRKGIPEGARI